MSYDDDWEDDDEKDEPETDLKLIAAALIIEKGNVDAAERQFRKDYEMDMEQAQDAIAEGLMLVVANAPRSIRGSFDGAVAWHRWNALYQSASKKKNVADMTTAQKQMDALIARIH